MSLGQLSSRGKQNNKLYLIRCTTQINNKDVSVNFYSTQYINTKKKLLDFLLSCDNLRINVFGDNYDFQNNDLIIPSAIKYYTTSSFYLYYYKNDGAGWRGVQCSNTTFYLSEV